MLLKNWWRIGEGVGISLDLLNVKIGPEHSRGESFYKDRLGDVVQLYFVGMLETPALHASSTGKCLKE